MPKLRAPYRPVLGPKLRSNLVTATEMLRKIEEDLGDLSRMSSYMPLDREDEQLCVLAGESAQELAQILAEFERVLDPDSDPPQPPAEPADA